MTELEDIKKIPFHIIAKKRIPSLQRDGVEYKGLCPFHKEDTPSFTIRKASSGVYLFKCFGCHANGNVMQFVQKFDKVDFATALRKVKKEMEWSEGKESVESAFSTPLQDEKIHRTFPLSDMVPITQSMQNSPEAKNWLASRGIDLETASSLHWGYTQSVKAISPNHPWVEDGWIVMPTYRGKTVVMVKYRSVKGKKTENGKNGFVRMKDTITCLYNLDDINVFEDAFLVEGEPDCAIMKQAGYATAALPSADYHIPPEERDILMHANRLFLAGDMDEVGRNAMTKLWSELRDGVYLIEWPEGCKDANDAFIKHCNRNQEAFNQLVEDLKSKALEKPIPDFYDMQQTLKNTNFTTPADNPNRLHAQDPEVDKMAITLPGNIVSVFATYPGTGKALKNGTGVLTLKGFVPIESLKVGDFVYSDDGYPTEVLGVFPQGKRKTYKMEFSCGTEIICDEDHIWAFERSMKGYPKKPFLRTTKQIATKSLTKSHPYKLPKINPPTFKHQDFIINPYLLGLLLGDGGFTNTSVIFTTGDEELLHSLCQTLPEGVVAKKQAGSDIDFRLTGSFNRGNRNPLKQELESMGLLNHRSEEKFIPAPYFLGSVKQRTDLLNGLLDTDGTVDRRTEAISFSSSSKQLATDVRNLVFSLGGFASISEKKTKRLLSYIVSINLPLNIKPFKLSRKLNIADRRKGWSRVRALRKISECGEYDTTCIKVSRPNGIFLIDGYIPTHNTTWILDQLELPAVLKYSQIVLNYSAELSPEEFGRLVCARMLSKNRLEITKEDSSIAAQTLEKSNSKFYVGYNPDITDPDKVLDTLEWAIRRLGANIVVLDHLHFYCRGDKDIQQQARAMQRAKNLARKYNLIFIMVGQSRKAQQNRKNRPSELEDAKGSETFISDATTTYHLHRSQKKNIDWDDPQSWPSDLLDPVTDIRLVKCRTKGPGKAVARQVFDGERGMFMPYTNQTP